MGAVNDYRSLSLSRSIDGTKLRSPSLRNSFVALCLFFNPLMSATGDIPLRVNDHNVRFTSARKRAVSLLQGCNPKSPLQLIATKSTHRKRNYLIIIATCKLQRHLKMGLILLRLLCCASSTFAVGSQIAQSMQQELCSIVAGCVDGDRLLQLLVRKALLKSGGEIERESRR